MNVLYDRQKNLEMKKINTATIVGCGGIGFWVGLYLAMSGCSEIFLIDADTLEVTNLNRLPYTSEDIGKNKAIALMEFIKRVRPECNVIPIQEYLTPENAPGLIRGTHVFSCADKHIVDDVLFSLQHYANFEFCRCAYDGKYISVSDTIPMRIGEPKEGYTIIPSWIIPSALTGAIAVLNAYELNPEKRVEFLGEMSQISHKKIPCDKEEHYRNYLLKQIDNKKIPDYRNCQYCDKCTECTKVDPYYTQQDLLKKIRNMEYNNYGCCIQCKRPTIDGIKDGAFNNIFYAEDNKSRTDLAMTLLKSLINMTPRSKRKIREFITEWEANYGRDNTTANANEE
jgi:hypothetical protein